MEGLGQGGSLVQARWWQAPHSELVAQRITFIPRYSVPAEEGCLSPVFLKCRACLPGKSGLKGVSQGSEDCCWPEPAPCCSVLADKHKLERFLRPDAALVVTVYAPITFPPASVLLFKQRSNGKLVSAEEVASRKQMLAGCSHTPLTSAPIQKL